MEEPSGQSSLWAWGADLFGDIRHVESASAKAALTNLKDSTRPLRGSDTAARGLAGRVELNSCVQLQHGIQMQRIVSGSNANHALLVLAWKLPWVLERVLWIGVLKGEHQCLLSRLPLDGPRTSFILFKIIEMVSAPA